jgi:hypothetical protein
VFVGQLSLALASKRIAPEANLGWFMAGVTMLDLVWPVFVLTGIESVRIVPGATAFTPFVFEYYPWSHSLLMAAIWGVVLAVIARLRRVAAASVLLVVLVMSHWLLDYITHAPDMPLWPGTSPRLGLGLWNSIPMTLAIEGAMWVTGIVMYLRLPGVRSAGRQVAFWLLVGLTTVMWVSGPWWPPPPSAQALGWLGLIGWSIIPWSAWADRRN